MADAHRRRIIESVDVGYGVVEDNPPTNGQVPERIGVVESAQCGSEGGNRRYNRGARYECADQESAQTMPSR